MNTHDKLIVAISNQNEILVKEYAQMIPDIDYKEGEFLKIACKKNNLNIVKILIDNGAKKLNNGLVVSIHNINIVKYLISLNADIYYNNSEIIFNTVDSGHFQTFKYVISLFPTDHLFINVDLAKKCLDESAQSGRFNFVEYFITNNYGDLNSAFICSIDSEDLHIVKYILKNGANINFDESCALRKVCETGFFEIVEYLLDNGADLHARDESALKHSIEFEQNDISILLIERGANINIANGLLLYKSIYHDTFVITKKLIEYGAEIHDYLFVWACKYGNVDTVKYLVSLGIKICDLGLQIALYRQYNELVGYLITLDLKASLPNQSVIDFIETWTNYTNYIQQMHIPLQLRKELNHYIKDTQYILYRGFSFTERQFQEFQSTKHYNIHDVITLHSTESSWTIDLETAHHFAQGVTNEYQLILKLIPDKKDVILTDVNLAHITFKSQEYEVILNSGSYQAEIIHLSKNNKSVTSI
jgi:ankyrin repeat protein